MPDGVLLVLDIVEPADDLRKIKGWVQRSVARGPPAALILRVPESTPPGLIVQVVRRAGLRHVDAVVEKGRWSVENLRGTLTSPIRLIDRLIDWLELRRGDAYPGDLRAYLAGWLTPSEAAERRPLSRVPRPLRARLAEEGLPTPRRIVQLGETLPAVLRIQGEPETSIERIALESGLSAAYSLRRRIQTLFDLLPSAFRDTLGWQWVVQRWIDRFCRGGDR